MLLEYTYIFDMLNHWGYFLVTKSWEVSLTSLFLEKGKIILSFIEDSGPWGTQALCWSQENKRINLWICRNPNGLQVNSRGF